MKNSCDWPDKAEVEAYGLLVSYNASSRISRRTQYKALHVLSAAWDARTTHGLIPKIPNDNPYA